MAHAIRVGLNAARAEAQLGPLGGNDRLDATARSLSADLAASGRCSHDDRMGADLITRLQRAGYAPIAYGEILACGSESPAEVLGEWQASSAHRQIVLDKRFHEAGVGLTSGGRDGPVWVVTFGAER